MHIIEYPDCTLIRETRGKLPRLPFVDMKRAILGNDYHLTFVCVGLHKGQELHRKWKKKDTPLNILSFPLDEKTGEIYITLEAARRECRSFGRSYHNYIAFLFIHGCTHLKGFAHGSTMEREESNIRKQFGFD